MEQQCLNATPWLVSHLSRILIGLLVIAALAGVITIAAYMRQFAALGLSDSQIIWAAFGDFVGGTLNAIVGYCALIALALTLRVQSIELKMSTQELNRSALALVEQNRSLVKQNFENTFFQLLRLHNDNVAGLDLRRSGNVFAEGRDCFKVLFNRLESALTAFFSNQESFETGYARFFENNGQNLGHYFRHLYRVYKFVAESEVEGKRGYAGIVRAQLSSYELALIYYNGLSALGGKFKPLLEDFAVFENMDFGKVESLSGAGLSYSLAAFGDRSEDWVRKERVDVL